MAMRGGSLCETFAFTGSFTAFEDRGITGMHSVYFIIFITLVGYFVQVKAYLLLCLLLYISSLCSRLLYIIVFFLIS